MANFWENDPVVSAPQGGPAPVFTAPDPVGVIERERDVRAEGRDAAAEQRAARGETRDVDNTAFQRASTYRTEFLSNPEVRQFREVRNIAQQINSLASREGSAMGDLGLVFSFMKSLDPGSTVMAGEQATAQNAAGVPGQIRNAYNSLVSGERLNTKQRADMASIAQSNVAARAAGYNELAQTYRGLLEAEGFSPDEQGITLFELPEPAPTGVAKDPTQADIYANGAEMGADKWGKDGSFDRSAYLADRYGLDGGQEAKIIGFWNANLGNRNLTIDAARDWYTGQGLDPPNNQDLAQAVQDAQGGVPFAAIDTAQAQADYQAQLDAALEQRGANPESVSGAIGVNAGQGFMFSLADEAAGVGGFGNALLNGGDPVAAYGAERDIVRREQERAQAARPITSAVSELLPAVATGALVPGRYVRSAGDAAKVAGAEGTIYGYGSGEGLGDSLRQAAVGGATGTVMGYGASKGIEKLVAGRQAARVARGEPPIPLRQTGEGDEQGWIPYVYSSPDGPIPMEIRPHTGGQFLEISVDEKNLDGANRLGVGAVRKAIGEIKAEFPEVRVIHGLRISGANPNQVTGINVDKYAAATRPVPVATNDGREVIQAADRLNTRTGSNIQPLPADVGGATVRRATSGTAQATFGAQPIVRASERMADETKGAVEALAAQEGRSLTPQGAGEQAIQGADKTLARLKTRVDANYAKAKRLSGDTRVPLTNASASLDQHIAELADTPGGAKGLKRLQDLRAEINGEWTPEGIRRMRTQLRDEFATDGLRGSDLERRAMDVVDSAELDIEQGLVSAGKLDAAQAWKEASASAAERFSLIDDVIEPILGKRGDRSGEGAFKAVESLSKGDAVALGKFMKALPEEEAGAVRATIITRLGKSTKGQQDADGEAFSLARFLTNYNDEGLSPEAKSALFSGELRAALDDVARVAQGTKEAQGYANRSNTAGGNFLNVMLNGGPFGAALFDPVTAGAALGGSVAMQAITGRVLASPSFARWLARAGKVTTPGSAQSHARGLSKIAQAEPAIATQVLGLQDALLNALTPATKVAAQDDQDQSEASAKSPQAGR